VLTGGSHPLEQFTLWDLRSASPAAKQSWHDPALGTGVHSVLFHQSRSNMFFLGSESGVVSIWDLRSTDRSLFSLHAGPGVCVRAAVAVCCISPPPPPNTDACCVYRGVRQYGTLRRQHTVPTQC
jgi:hypothetical protein